VLGHLPAPAKITVRVLEPIDLRAAYGSRPDFDRVYDDVVEVMQRELARLAGERRLPVLG